MKTRFLTTLWLLAAGSALAQTYPGPVNSYPPISPATNDPPVWEDTPAPSFTTGQAASYNLPAVDPESVQLTIVNETGCTLSANLTIDDSVTPTTLDYDGTGTEATLTDCVFSADDGVNDPVNSASFSIPIVAGGAQLVVNGAGGDDFTTIQACLNAAQCGETCAVKNGNYAHFSTVRACTAGNPVTVEAFSGHSPVVNGSATVVGEEGNAHCLHPFNVIGEGMTFLGTNPAAYQTTPVAGNPETNFIVDANDCTLKGEFTRGRLANVRIDAGVQRTIFEGARVTVAGSHDRGPSNNPPYNDAGQNIYMKNSGSMLFFMSYMDAGGHNGFESGGGGQRNIRIEDSLLNQNWDKWYGLTDSLDINRGQRAGEFDGIGFTMRNTVASYVRGSSEESNFADSTWKSSFSNGSVSGLFILEHHSGPSIGAGAIATSENTPVNQYWDHFTISSSDGACFSLNDNGARPTDPYGPFHYKNGICNLPSQAHNHTRYSSPVGTSNARCIFIRYQTTGISAPRNHWSNYVFFENVKFSSNCQVRIHDQDGTGNNDYSLSELMALYPANFVNVTVNEAPNFVSTVASTSEDPATAIASAKTNFVPQATGYLNCTDCWLTLVNGPVADDNEVAVEDAGWFRDAEGWSQVQGDQIHLCGVTRRITDIVGDTLTLDGNVTCDDDDPVYRYDDDSPHIGASQAGS